MRVAIDMSWRELLFVHFACEPEVIQAMLPPGLTVDTFPDSSGRAMAWVGLVPFRMEGVFARGVPRVQRCAAFPETNVRTYCHREGREPGVWFFSLDAANPFACMFARRFFSLNYREATMSVARAGDSIEYASRRWREPKAENSASCVLGPEIGEAQPGTLEFFLVERYLLYSRRGARLFCGQVYHPPYQLRRVEEFRVSSGLIEVNGIVPRPWVHAVFSDGVDVVGGPIAPVT